MIRGRGNSTEHERRMKARPVFLENIITVQTPGREAAEQISFSRRGNIQGAQCLAVAGKVYEAARAQGMGHELPTEWFLQDIRD
ncbi:MAG: hypothetical protein ACKVVP_02795 [Chloroflexota bacterium]